MMASRPNLLRYRAALPEKETEQMADLTEPPVSNYLTNHDRAHFKCGFRRKPPTHSNLMAPSVLT